MWPFQRLWYMTPNKICPKVTHLNGDHKFWLTKKVHMFIWSLKNENKFFPMIEPFVHWDDIRMKSNSIQKSNFHAHPLMFTIWQFMFIPFWNLNFFINFEKNPLFWEITVLVVFDEKSSSKNSLFSFWQFLWRLVSYRLVLFRQRLVQIRHFQ